MGGDKNLNEKLLLLKLEFEQCELSYAQKWMRIILSVVVVGFCAFVVGSASTLSNVLQQLLFSRKKYVKWVWVNSKSICLVGTKSTKEVIHQIQFERLRRVELETRSQKTRRCARRSSAVSR